MSISNEPSKSPSRKTIAIILLAALVLRLGFAATRSMSREVIEALPDQLQYLQLARNVLDGQGYWLLDDRVADRAVAFRTPGYPFFVALCGANVRIVRIVQAFVDTGTVWAVYLLATLVLPARAKRRGACIAAALVAFNPFLIYFCGLVLSEVLSCALLLWGMTLLVLGKGDNLRKPRTSVWLAGGLLLAIMILAALSIVLPIVLGVGSAFVNRTAKPAYQLRWPLPVGATMLLCTLLVLTPWAVRNHQLLHQWVWLDTNSGFTLYDGYNPDATGASDQRFAKQMPQLRHMGEVQRSQYLRGRAIEFARQHPARVLELMRARLVRTWSPVPLSDQYSGKLYHLVGLCYSLPFDLVALWGIFNGNLPRAAKVFLLLPAIYLSGIHMLTVGSLRYRLPAEPSMAIVAASGLVRRKS